jgi:hypothetical protein
MADVDDLRGGLDSQNHALHDADKMVGEAEVGGERDDGPGHSPLYMGCAVTVNSHRRQDAAATTTVTVALPRLRPRGTCALICVVLT